MLPRNSWKGIEMKKFITYISRQARGQLLSGTYKPHGNRRLEVNEAIHFPVITMVNGYAEEGESIQVYALYGIGNKEYSDNLEVLKEDIEKIRHSRNFQYEVIPVPVSEEETSLEHLKTFQKIAELIQDNDQIFLCCTYGSKPMPVVEMMALNFAYRVHKNVSIECMVYGKVNHTAVPKSFDVYDITALFDMMQITNVLAESRAKDPIGYIARLLDQDEGE